ncbi:uncharacterized protein PGTG_00889 [Puccinia graminis f. sp. tritici CRL 75-36-700-3]|uniref:Uncharacterized protein n=1 Tax=Puccinia graminis f. sp. tritici (strain CRL 75-36-700-3 / race SCCL) TaxID=418459 RepID=E3JU33_PUCGT|nr:uncharacterized protein PGTG_00889 [Puccinia graminis f. sp. tritici CRL 75-36-700-3]EFP75558.1 hypothetical protein PGTG_00889 [Puccinia graminis f. sp. tritici CRL 75-36-700-3]
MLDAFTRYSRSKLIRRDSGSSTHGSGTLKAQLSRRISSDEPGRTLESPEPSIATGSSAGSFLSSHSGDSQPSGPSLKQTLVKFRQQRLRPLSILAGNPKLVRNRRPSHSRESEESTDSGQFQVGAMGRILSSDQHSSHFIPRAALEQGGDYVIVHSEYAQALPNNQQPHASMPEISSNKKPWSYNLESLPCGIRSSEKLVVEEESDGSLDDEMLDTLCTLRYTIQQIKDHRRQSPKSNPLVKCDSLPTFGLTSTGHQNLLRTLSVPSRFIEDKAASFDLMNGSGLPYCLVSPAHLLNQLPSIHAGNHSTPASRDLPNPGMIENEDEGDDTSFCTLPEEEPDYQSGPYVLPIWPNLPSALQPAFDPKC